MKRLQTGYRVEDIRGRTVGNVSAIGECCFQVARPMETISLVQESIFDVQDRLVTLVCDDGQCLRYACPIHGSSSADAMPSHSSASETADIGQLGR
ncbi:MAG: hypothetical protein ABI577_03290 [bacterium]